MPKPRFVYIMERRRFLGFLRKTREIKVGVSNDPRRRRNEVEDGIPGRFVIRKVYRTPDAFKIEAEVHKNLKKFRFKPKGAKRGAGGSEFFRLTPAQIRDLRRHLADKTRPKKPPLWVLLAFAVFLYLIFNLIG